MATYRANVCGGNEANTKKKFPKLESGYLGVILSLIFTEYTTVKLLPEKKITLAQTLSISKISW